MLQKPSAPLDRVQQPVDRPDVLRRHPAVHGDADDLRTAGPQRLDEPRQRLPVQLEGHPAPGDALRQQPVQHLGHRLGGR